MTLERDVSDRAADAYVCMSCNHHQYLTPPDPYQAPSQTPRLPHHNKKRRT